LELGRPSIEHELIEIQVLLRGCRCIEIDVWDGEPKPPAEESKSVIEDGKVAPWSSYTTASRAEPRVLHGMTG
jgi:hypothetical protein